MPSARLHPEHRTPCFASNQNSPSTPSFDLRLALFLRKSPSFACSFWVVSCARRSWCMCGVSHLRLAWCSTPPTADAYTTRSCYAGLPARSGHIILSCGVHFRGGGLKGMLDRTMPLRLVQNSNETINIYCKHMISGREMTKEENEQEPTSGNENNSSHSNV